MNGGWLESDDHIFKRIETIRHIPTAIVQGRYDMVCPPQTAWELHKVYSYHNILYAQILTGGNIDGFASFRSLTGKILTDSLLENLYLLYNLKRKILTKHQIHQYFCPSKFCTIQ